MLKGTNFGWCLFYHFLFIYIEFFKLKKVLTEQNKSRTSFLLLFYKMVDNLKLMVYNGIIKTKEMKFVKKLVALLFFLSLMFGVYSVSYANTSQLKLGDYIYFGKYNDEAILWRVINVDENGNPMLFSNKVISYKRFGDNNDYKTSNIRQWLNSTDGAGQIKWIHSPPSPSSIGYEAVYNKGYVYDLEKGFLANGNFSDMERSFIQPITHKVITFSEQRDGGNEFYRINNLLMPENLNLNVIQNYDNAYHNTVTDYVFLLSTKQLKQYVYDRGYDVRTYATKKAVDIANYGKYVNQPNRTYEENYANYYLNTNSNTSSNALFNVSGSNEHIGHNHSPSNFASGGVRPAVQLDVQKVNFRFGNGTQSSPYMVDNGLDNDAPSQPKNLKSTEYSKKRAVLTWDASTDNVSVVGYEVFLDGVKVSETNQTSYTVNNIVIDKDYLFQVRAKDGASNYSRFSNITLRHTIDRELPTQPKNLSITNISTNGFDLEWTPSTDNVALWKYVLSLNDAYFGETTTTKFQFRNLVEGKRYKVSVRAFDSSGNASLSSDTFISTLHEIDLQAPTVPSALGIKQSKNNFKVTWNESTDNKALMGYEVYVDDDLYTMTDANEAEINLWTENKSHNIKVRAYDRSRNYSSFVDIAVRTVDITTPTVPLDFSVARKQEGVYTLSWSKSTDNSSVNYKIYLNDKLITTTSNTTHEVANVPNKKNKFSIEAVDVANNKSGLKHETTHQVKVKQDKVYVDGVALQSTYHRGHEMILYEDVFKVLGYSYTWDSRKKLITATKNGQTIQIAQQSRMVRMGATKFKLMPIAPLTVRNKIYVPMSFFAKEFGFTITK